MKISDEMLANMHEGWMAAFEERFGHLDFWRLSKKWKRIRYKQFADIIIMDLRMFNEELNAEDTDSDFIYNI